jgi:adenylate cyclase
MPAKEPHLEVLEVIDASAPVLPAAGAAPDAGQHLALLHELPTLFAQQTALEPLLQTITERLVASIPGAMRGSMLLADRASGELLLKAHIPTGEPAASLMLARQAMDRRQGFIWRRGRPEDRSAVSSEHHAEAEAAMYAPLMWRGNALGVVCVDSHRTVFKSEDLRLMVAAAHYLSMAAVEQRLLDEIRESATLLNRVMTSFSPQTRDQLISKARDGRLRLGGSKSEVVVLFYDIHHFTQLSMRMEPEEVFDMLNDYLSPLVEAIFKCDGTIDKFMGDGILAVFGSPEPDRLRHEKAVRAALAMQQAMNSISAARRARQRPTLEARIGLHCGQVLHGFIGSSERLEYTVMGETVNLASRFCDGAGCGEILISPELHQRVWEVVEVEPVAIDTKHEGRFPAFRLKGMKSAQR